MIHGIGTDIVDINRIKQVYLNNPDKFVNKILSSSEQAIFNSLQLESDKIDYLATRWAAKEAVVKAIGTGFRDGMYLAEISISNNKHGRPEVVFSEPAADILTQKFIGSKYSVHISLSGEKSFAIAYCIIEIL